MAARAADDTMRVSALSQTRGVLAAQLTVMWRERRVAWLALVAVILACTSAGTSAVHLAAQARERQAVAAEEARLWNHQGTIDPHAAAHVGRAIPAPVRPLASFDPGVSNVVGTSVFIEGHAQNPARHRPIEEGAALSRFGGFSAAWALQVIAPLLLILAGFSSMSGDVARERLRQELAAGGATVALVGGRLLALAAAGGLLALPLLGASLPAMILQQAGAATLGALLAMTVGYLLYLLAFCALTIAISGLCRSARTSLVILLCFWVATTLLAPRVAPAVAESLVPTPSAPAFRAAVSEEAERGVDGHDPADVRLEALKAALLKRYAVDDVAELPVNFRGVALEFAENNSTRTYARHFERLYTAYRQQEQVQRALAAVSPTLALQPWSRAFAETDFAAHLTYLRGVEDYRYRLIQALNHEVKAHKPAPGARHHVADIASLTRAVAYTPKAQTLPGIAVAQLPNLLILLGWVLLGLCLTLLAAARLGTRE